ncbi:hypothetical protein ACRQ4C_16940 [Curtobacterium sp. SP.BCp]|uniref:hypothetical protein n=1 Tax=Curtobacterium sp. SP.BCp TaxID=3435230 RepID=UPI003F73CF35
MSSRSRTAAATIVAATVAVLLAGCTGAGAQNGNPVGKGPASDDPARTTCPVAAKEAVDVIDEAVGAHDDTDFASVREGDGGWYLGASIAPAETDDPNDDDVTVWATSSDPTSEDFDGPLWPVNRAAKDAAGDQDGAASAAPSAFTDDSDAARSVQQCVVNAANR